jgi:hypothetical protein
MGKIVLLTAIAIALGVVFVGPEVVLTFDPPTTVLADCGGGGC